MATKKKDVQEKYPFPLAPEKALTLGGKKYRLCLDFGVIREAEEALLETGIRINLLRSLDFKALGARSLPEVFFAALRRYQPEMTFEDVCALITLDSAIAIFEAVGDAYVLAMGVSGQDANPRGSGEQSSKS
jgi:hypothetical protein